MYIYNQVSNCVEHSFIHCSCQWNVLTAQMGLAVTVDKDVLVLLAVSWSQCKN